MPQLSISTLDIRQSNHEGHLIDWLHEAEETGAAAVILNAGGYSHTSVALHDAVLAIATPVIAVHLSDPATREPFRHIDLVALAATAQIKGQGAAGLRNGTGRGGPALTGSALRNIEELRVWPEPKGQQSMRVDSALVRELAELLSANELTEIEVEDGDRKIKVVRRDVSRR